MRYISGGDNRAGVLENMHSRHQRNPRNGYRSGPMGGSNMAVGSHASPEGPGRGPGFYKPDIRNFNFNRSFSRNQSQAHNRNFHRPPAAPQTPTRADVFMEVGRLAAEYLVSQGVLPPSVLPTKWQNGSLRKPFSEFGEFRSHDEENMQFPAEARTSALTRLGNTGFDVGSGRRKYNDDFGTAGVRNYMRGKRKGGSSRNYGSDWGRDYGLTALWSDRHRDRTSPSTDLDKDSSSRRREEHPGDKDNGDRRATDYDSGSKWHEDGLCVKDEVDRDTKSRWNVEHPFGKGDSDMSELTATCATPPKGMENKDSESKIKEKKLVEELSEMKDSDVIKAAQEITSGEIKNESVDLGCSQQINDNELRISREETEHDLRSVGEITEEISDSNKDETGKEIISQYPTPQHFAAPMSLSENNGTDLKALCKFANVPTRIRSSLAGGAKGRSILSSEGTELTGATEGMVIDNNLSVSTNDGSSGGCDKPNVLDPEMPNVKSPQVVEEERVFHFDDAMELAQGVDSRNSHGDGKPNSVPFLYQATGARPEPLEDGIIENDQSLNQEGRGSMSADYVVEKRGKKRPHGGIDMDGKHARRQDWLYEGTRDWLSPASINAGNCSNLSNPVNGEVNIHGDSLSGGENTTRVSQGSSVDNFQLPEVMHRSSFVDSEEKQFFPSSFKICDLNLMESSNAHESNDRDAVFMYPSISVVKKNALPIDIDLSIYNSIKSAENSTHVADGRGIDIIDLEGDSAPGEKTFSVTERRTEAEFMGLEGFSAPAPNAADIPDSQDGYGLMISELLANDFPSVTSVPGDINPLDNAGLHNGEGPLADDDSIYMSLEEIPFLKFLRNWENPAPQEDGKPF